MAPKRRGRSGSPANGAEPNEGEPDNGGEDGYNGEESQGPGNPDAQPVRIHREFVVRHVGEGAPATPEQYRQAVEQWHALPGAIRRPPVDLTGNEEPQTPDADQGAEPPDELT